MYKSSVAPNNNPALTLKRKRKMQKEPQKITEQEFNDLFIASIDEALSALGEGAKTAIYYHIEKKFNIKKQEIPTHLTSFIEAIEKLFGLGSKPLELMLMQKLHAKLNTNCKPIKLQDFTFTSYVNAIKKNIVMDQKGIGKPNPTTIQEQNINQENNLVALLNLIADPVTIVDSDGTFLFINCVFEKIMGIKSGDLVGKSSVDMPNISSEAKMRIKETLEKRKKGLKVDPYEIDITDNTGQKRLFEINAKKIEYAGQSATLVVCREITQRKMFEKQLKEYAENLEWLVNKRAGEIKESEEKLKSIFDSSPDAIFVVNSDGTVLECNNAAINLLRCTSKKEIVGQNGFEFIAEADRKNAHIGLKKAASGEALSNVTFNVLTKDGHVLPCEFSARAIKDSLGHSSSIVVTLRDVSERVEANRKLLASEKKYRQLSRELELAQKNLLQERDMLEAITENIGAGLAIIGKDYRVLWSNKFLKQALGDVDNKVCYSTFNTLNGVCPSCGPKKIFEGASFDSREYFSAGLPPQNRPQWIELIATPIKDKDGNITSVLELTVNITEKKAMQNKLAEYSQKLEKLVGERTEQLQRTQAKLVRSERLAAIGELASMVGHDLRNPLTSIKGAAYLLKAKCAMNMDATGKEMLSTINNSIDYSNKIINDLLDYSRDIKLELTETTPKALLKMASALIEIPGKIKIVDKMEDTSKIRADTGKMSRVFVNIIRNAFDAMPEGGNLQVTSRETEGNLEICFEDTGTGMEQETLKKLWTPLFTTKAKGMGFGLPICKRIVEAHGGRITAESIVGKGTTFIVTVPINPKMATETEDMGVFSGPILSENITAK